MTRTRKWIALFAVVAFFGAYAAPGETKNAQAVTSLLREFMDAAGRSDRAVFDKFFAEDVIYTRATGKVITKSEIMASLRAPAAETPEKTTYSAQDLTVHEYGETIIVAFRLAAHTERADGKVENANYRNTGTFVRRNGQWQAVAWQATKIAEPSVAP